MVEFEKPAVLNLTSKTRRVQQKFMEKKPIQTSIYTGINLHQ